MGTMTREKMTQRCEARGIPASLAEAVFDQLSPDDDDELRQTLSDVAGHGAGGGFSGFIYHSETAEFFQANRADIRTLATAQAEDFGQGVLEMVAGFNCLKPDATPDEAGRVLYGNDDACDAYAVIANALAWYALEEVARAVTDD